MISSRVEMEKSQDQQESILFECDFSSHTCGMTNEIITPDFTWSRIRWNTPSDDTGPDGDASHDGQGYRKFSTNIFFQI